MQFMLFPLIICEYERDIVNSKLLVVGWVVKFLNEKPICLITKLYVLSIPVYKHFSNSMFILLLHYCVRCT